MMNKSDTVYINNCVYIKSFSAQCISDIYKWFLMIHCLTKTTSRYNSSDFLKCSHRFGQKIENGTLLFSISQLLLNRTQRLTDWTKTEQFRNNTEEKQSKSTI